MKDSHHDISEVFLKYMIKRRFGTAHVQRRSPNEESYFLNVEALNSIMDPILTPIICPFMKGNHPFNS